MSERWQNTDFFKPYFLDICQEACAISDSDGSIEAPDSSALDTNHWRRSAMFRDLRQTYADNPLQMHELYELGWLPVGDDEPTTKIFDRARECAARIVAGECTRFVFLEDPSTGKNRIMTEETAKNLGLRDDN